jgi:hypothetical protein
MSIFASLNHAVEGESMTRLSNLTLLLASPFILSGNRPAFAAPKEERVTVTYDVGQLLNRDGKSGVDSIDEVVKTIVNQVNPHAWLLSPDGGNRIFEVNGSKLEILATRKDHDNIKELLEVMRRMNDIRVDVRTTFLAVDPKWYEKEIAPHLNKARKASDEDEEQVAKDLSDLRILLKKNSEVLQSGNARLPIGRGGSLASLRQFHSYATGKIDEDGVAVWGVEWTGVSYRCRTAVSADRRFVTFKIDETFREPEEKRDGESVPRSKEKKKSEEITIPDGGMYLRKAAYTPESAVKRGRVLMVLIEPRILIEEEEKERRGNKGDG